MSPTRRDFIRTLGVAAGGVYAHGMIAELLAQTPPGQVRQSKFKGLADIVLNEAKAAGCSYADVRFTMNTNLPGGSARRRRRGPCNRARAAYPRRS